MAYIDTHVHFWKYNKQRDGWMDDMKVLQKDHLPPQIESTLSRNGIDGCIAVQASQEEVETRFLSELAETWPFIRGVVGWVDLLDPNLTEKLQELATAHPVIKGYRHVVQGEPNDFLLRKDFQAGVQQLKAFNYTYDILIYHYQLPAAASFVKEIDPEITMIVDHCAKPDVKNKEIKEWEKWMREIALQPNIYCKLSGLFTEAKKDWSAADFYPYLDVVFDAFGTDRLLFGSDWPVMLASGMYVQWKSLIEKYMENLDPEERDKVFGANAIKAYRLAV